MQPNDSQLNLEFLNLDHPIIIVTQVILAGVLFRIYFLLHRRPMPIPLLQGLAPFVLLLDAFARYTHQPWFWIVNSIMWVLFLAVAYFAFRYANNVTKTEEQKRIAAGGLEPEPDFHDTWQRTAVWTFTAACGVVLGYYSITLWNEKEANRYAAETNRADVRSEVIAEQNQQEEVAAVQRGVIIGGQLRIKAQNDSLLNLAKNGALGTKGIRDEQKSVAKDMVKAGKKLKRDAFDAQKVLTNTAKDVDTTKREVRGLTKPRRSDGRFNYSPSDEVPASPADNQQKQKPSFWQRITKPFRRTTSRLTAPAYPDTDSTRTARQALTDSASYVTY